MVVKIIAGIIGYIVVTTFIFALCKSAGDYDRFMERTLNMNEQERWNKAYNEYKEKFARDRGITVEEAAQYQVVKNYKDYLEKEHGVEIFESGCEHECI